MAKRLGRNARAYENTAYDGTAPNSATPTWRLRNRITDVTIDNQRDETEISDRDSGGYKQYAAGLAEASISFDLIYDTDDTEFFDVLDVAFRDGNLVEMFFCDAALGTVDGSNDLDATTTGTDGVRGFRGAFTVTNFSEQQSLSDAVRFSCTLRLAGTIPTPGYYVKSGGPSASYALVTTS